MDEARFYQKPWFYYLTWSFFWVGVYLWQIWRLGGFAINTVYIFTDAVLFGFGLLLWLAFFAQFVLPVHTFQERQKIFDRLITYLSGAHGPAIFIENGRIRESAGEKKKKGPGILWLDSASAAVTRTEASFKNTLCPGVHFIEKGESIAGIVDLHIQTQTIGPWETESPFDAKKESQSIEEYKQIQNRRAEVSAWTRDGIEVVPRISVSFKIDAEPVTDPALPGSRFGFDPEAVRKAVTGEGIIPDAPADSPRRRVAWNRLPALIAVDIWREYLAKFTLAELFEATQVAPTPANIQPAPVHTETQALYRPFVPSGSAISNALAGMLHEINVTLTRWADTCEGVKIAPQKPLSETQIQADNSPAMPEGKKETALEMINRLVSARMMNAEVNAVDDSGKPLEDMLPSREYKLLKDRGIKIISVNIGSFYFTPIIEEQLTKQWNASWLDNANAERSRIERQRGFFELDSQTVASNNYALSLSKKLLKEKPATPKETLKTLLLRSRDELVKDDRLHRRASMEREELEEIIQWVERNSA